MMHTISVPESKPRKFQLQASGPWLLPLTRHQPPGVNPNIAIQNAGLRINNLLSGLHQCLQASSTGATAFSCHTREPRYPGGHTAQKL